jgi:hypothetical protein
MKKFLVSMLDIIIPNVKLINSKAKAVMIKGDATIIAVLMLLILFS